MKNYIQYATWFHIITAIAIIIFVLNIIAYSRLRKAKNRFKTANEIQDKLRSEIIKNNKILLDCGMTETEIFDFQKECMPEALIQHHLPPCSCQDVNECETWCQAKARFTLKPPID